MDQKDIFIVTNETQAKMMKERTAGRIAADHILAEPAARNTAAMYRLCGDGNSA